MRKALGLKIPLFPRVTIGWVLIAEPPTCWGTLDWGELSSGEEPRSEELEDGETFSWGIGLGDLTMGWLGVRVGGDDSGSFKRTGGQGMEA